LSGGGRRSRESAHYSEFQKVRKRRRRDAGSSMIVDDRRVRARPARVKAVTARKNTFFS
jgi:hypothetical protein